MAGGGKEIAMRTDKMTIEKIARELEWHVKTCFNPGAIAENKWLNETVDRLFGKESLFQPMLRFGEFQDRTLTDKDPQDIATLKEMLENFGISGEELLEFLEKLKEVTGN